MLLDILLPCPRLVSRPFCPTRLLGINSSPSTHSPPCASSQFGAPLFVSQVCCPNLKPLAPLLFSCTYELQILQPLSFHNHTKCRGCVAHSHSLLLALFPARASRSSCLTLSSSADTINSSPPGLHRHWQFPRRIPMKLAYFDCFSGISGDMTLGALVDVGFDVDHLRAELRGLQVPGWELSAEKVWKNGMAATCVKVRTEDQSKHRSLSTILDILQKSQLAPQVRDRAAAIFKKLGEAEAHVHDVPLEKIHFHEVGAVDAIVDIVGACIGFHALGIEKFACSALN